MHSLNQANRENNFDLLRLGLSAAVIFSHCWFFVYGGYKQEPLFFISGHLKIGDVAVNGFFLLSGYLILASWVKTPKIFDYIRKRVLRIYPAFIAASIVSVAIGAWWNQQPLLAYLFNWDLPWNAFSLGQPTAPKTGIQLNVSLWTIRYEFFCYGAVGVLGLLFKREIKWPWVAAWALSMCAWISGCFETNLRIISLVRFFAYFLTGGMFYLFSESIVFRRLYAFLAVALLIPALINAPASRVFLPLAGGYLLFYAGFINTPLLNRVRPKNDISYGVYLYGWPTQKLLVTFFGISSPYLLFSAALPIAALLGLLSWKLVEVPFLRRKPGHR